MLFFRAVLVTSAVLLGCTDRGQSLVHGRTIVSKLTDISVHEHGKSIQPSPGTSRKEFHSSTKATALLQVGKDDMEVAALLGENSAQPAQTAQYKNWFSRLGDSISSVLLGLFIMIPFSMAFLYENEQRNARQESLFVLGAKEVQAVTSPEIAKEDGVLVHMDSADAKGLDPMTDQRFSAMNMDKGCLRMRSSAEAYQWEETEKKETKKDRVGGGETTYTTYEHSMGWHDTVKDSNSFREKNGHENHISVPGLELGTKMIDNTTVKYGDHHYLPEDLVRQLGNWQDASELVGASLSHQNAKLHKIKDYYYCGSNPDSPQVGDVRVKLGFVRDGPATVLALQAEDPKHQGSSTFLPYRMVSRGLCGGVSGEELGQRLVVQGRKDGHELYDEDKCDSGILCCLCACCNLVSCCFANLAPPQIFAAFPGKVSKEQAFENVKGVGMAMKWGFRLLGWLLLYAGTYMLFQPLLVVLDIIPFLGPYISEGVSWVVGLVVFLFTAILAMLVVSVAYLRFHPLMGFLYLAVAVAAVGAITILSGTAK